MELTGPFRWQGSPYGGLVIDALRTMGLVVLGTLTTNVNLYLTFAREKALKSQAIPRSKQIYTSGHDYLDAEKASCPMDTHWNTV